MKDGVSTTKDAKSTKVPDTHLFPFVSSVVNHPMNNRPHA